MTRPADFRTTLRHGRRVGGLNTVMHIALRSDVGPARFGFIVTRAVGGATTRNLVRRRLRAACREALPSLTASVDIVVRALPVSAHASWASLHDEIAQGLGKGLAEQ